MQFLPAKALKLLENVLKLKLRKLQKIIQKLVTTGTRPLPSGRRTELCTDEAI